MWNTSDLHFPRAGVSDKRQNRVWHPASEAGLCSTHVQCRDEQDPGYASLTSGRDDGRCSDDDAWQVAPGWTGDVSLQPLACGG